MNEFERNGGPLFARVLNKPAHDLTAKDAFELWKEVSTSKLLFSGLSQFAPQLLEVMRQATHWGLIKDMMSLLGGYYDMNFVDEMLRHLKDITLTLQDVNECVPLLDRFCFGEASQILGVMNYRPQHHTDILHRRLNLAFFKAAVKGGNGLNRMVSIIKYMVHHHVSCPLVLDYYQGVQQHPLTIGVQPGMARWNDLGAIQYSRWSFQFDTWSFIRTPGVTVSAQQWYFHEIVFPVYFLSAKGAWKLLPMEIKRKICRTLITSEKRPKDRLRAHFPSDVWWE